MPNVLERYQEFVDIFDKVKATRPRKHWGYDCSVELQQCTAPPFVSIYVLSPKDLEALHTYIEQNWVSGFIGDSHSPISAPIFFVKKKDNT